MPVRLDHVTVDNGVSGVCAGKRCDGKIIEERQDERNGDAEGRHGKEGKENNVDRCDKDDAEHCHNISLEAEDAEDQCVFEDLSERHIKGDEHEIEIESHEEIKDYECQNGKIAEIDPKAARHSHEIGKVKDEQEDGDNVDQSQQKALLEVSADGVKIIGKEKDGLTAHHASENIGGAHVLPSPRDCQKDDADADEDVGANVVIHGNAFLCTEQIEQGGSCGGGIDKVRAVKLCKDGVICDWCLICADSNVKNEQERQDHGEHHEVERHELPKTSAKELEIAF